MNWSLMFNRRNFLLALFFLLIYLLSLFSQLPAGVLANRFKLSRFVNYTQVTGSIWNGQLHDAVYSRLVLGDVRWQLHFLPLLTGTLSSEISSVNGKESLRGLLRVSSAKHIEAENFNGVFTVESLMPLFAGLPLGATGQVNLSLKEIIFNKDEQLHINGRIVLSSLKLSGIQKLDLGDVLIEFKPDEQQGSHAVIRASQGQVNVEGTLKISASGMLQLQAYLTPADNDPQISAMLKMLGKADASNRYRFNWKQNVF